MTRRCDNPECNAILGRFADPSITTCRKCRNKTNRKQAEEKEARAKRSVEKRPCPTPGCEGTIAARSRASVCPGCVAESQKIPCANPHCDNKIWAKKGKGRPPTWTGLCADCYRSSHKSGWRAQNFVISPGAQ